MASIRQQFSFLLLFVLTGFVKGGNLDLDDWSAWNEWSSCSRTCGGGVTQQFRKCVSNRGCHGVSIRRKMCNMQPCAEPRDFRTEQCKANNLDYKDWTRQWEALEDPDNPCLLICKVKNSDIYAKKTPKIRDGTSCKSGALHVCVEGKCESVGCDLKIGSPKKVDECGICGGNGSTCSTPIYRWEIIPNGPCMDKNGATITCGGGQQPVKVICRNSVTTEKVDQLLCNSSQKPLRMFQNCAIRACEPGWETSAWTPCSATCGEGMQQRKIFCAQEKNGTKITVLDKFCQHAHKPATEEKCFIEPCPFWNVGPWSTCSTSCGKGYKSRSVTCRTATNEPALNCVVDKKPTDTKPCSEGMCPSTSTTTTMSTTTTTITTKSYAPTVTIVATKVSTPPNGKKPGRRKTTMRLEMSSTQSPKMTDSPKYQYRSNIISNYLVYPTPPPNEQDQLEDFPQEHTLPLIQPYPPLDNNNFGHNSIPSDGISEPTRTKIVFSCGWLFLSFVADDWGPCLADTPQCGQQGLRVRDVKCKIFLEFSRTIANLPDKECPGPKPTETESCVFPCSNSGDKAMDDWKPLFPRDAPLYPSFAYSDAPQGKVAGLPPGINMQDMTFSFKVLGYSDCSAPCLSGTQDAIVQCVRDYDGRVANLGLCVGKPQPDIPTTRTCNDHVCLPRWNVSSFGSCSKSCGGGVMTRDVNCIHEVTRGNTVIVPNGVCPPPIPRTEMLCNTINCSPFWEPAEWSRCSKECGQGRRTRQIHCKQVIALGQVVEWSNPEGHCTQTRPMDNRPCNKKQCSNRKMQSISPAPFTYIQTEWKRKLSLTVKGEAKVFHEVSPLRLHCPVAKDDRSRVYWMKGDDLLGQLLPKLNRNNKNKIQMLTKTAVLKIHNLTYSDSGVYTCLVNQRPISNLTLAVVPFVGSREMRSSKSNFHQMADQQVVDDGGSRLNLLPTPSQSASSSSFSAFLFLRDVSLSKRMFILSIYISSYR